MPAHYLPRLAVLIDLPRTAHSGGHVRGWEKLAAAAATETDLPVDMTLFFSGPQQAENWSARTHLRTLPPVFSTEKLKFLPYVPDHTDLAPFHPALARELVSFDIIHSTDGFFAFARTAERVHRKLGIPLVTSFHTDTPGYARLFTQRTIDEKFGHGPIARFLTHTLDIPARQERSMRRRLARHLQSCTHAIAAKPEDIALSQSILGADRVSILRSPVDRSIFHPDKKNRAKIAQHYNIPDDRFLIAFAGRLDEGKNIYTLIDAMERLIVKGHPVHLITAGVGPAADDLCARLGTHVSLAGYLQPEALGALFASVDIVAHPSEVEVRSLIAIEAMSSGSPVLVSEKGGVARHYHFPQALPVVTGDGEAWATALEELLLHPEHLHELRGKALDYVETSAPSYRSLLFEDFMPHWLRAFAQKKG